MSTHAYLSEFMERWRVLMLVKGRRESHVNLKNRPVLKTVRQEMNAFTLV